MPPSYVPDFVIGGREEGKYVKRCYFFINTNNTTFDE